MNNNKNISPELENEHPFLDRVPKENHFNVPKNYFEVLPQVIQTKNLNNSKLLFLFDKLSYRILILVSAIAIALFVFISPSNTSIENELSSDQLCELIVDEDYIEFDDYLVYETYYEVLDEETELDENTASEADEYIDYLLENNIDINAIIDEL